MNFFIALLGSSSGLHCKSFAILHRTAWNLHGRNLLPPKPKHEQNNAQYVFLEPSTLVIKCLYIEGHETGSSKFADGLQ